MSIVRVFGVSTWVGFREEELYTGKNKSWRSKPKCVCVCVSVCVCVCVSLCMCLCVCVSVFICQLKGGNTFSWDKINALRTVISVDGENSFFPKEMSFGHSSQILAFSYFPGHLFNWQTSIAFPKWKIHFSINFCPPFPDHVLSQKPQVSVIVFY